LVGADEDFAGLIEGIDEAALAEGRSFEHFFGGNVRRRSWKTQAKAPAPQGYQSCEAGRGCSGSYNQGVGMDTDLTVAIVAANAAMVRIAASRQSGCGEWAN
jgi:hypothetical protein